ncbi:MAG TPA: hypothetical protein PLN85_00130 [archaeon]|nr:hypothetical protein [archaeon]
MNNKIRILFYNSDTAGVNYFRTQTPAIELEKNHSDDFYIEINPHIDFNDLKTLDYLKSFDIIHYHRQLHGNLNIMNNLSKELKKSGVLLIADIDDYWYLPQQHPFYTLSRERKLHIPIIENLKIADYVTTTTDLFASEIKKITNKDNVEVFYNSINPIWMKQFQNNWKPDPDGRVRITYMAGSCYDDKTEILTEDGWKLFKDLNKTEQVATLNPETNLIEYQKPTEYINEPYDGDMYYASDCAIDFAVTPNHKMYVSFDLKSGFELVEMSEVFNKKSNFYFKREKNLIETECVNECPKILYYKVSKKTYKGNIYCVNVPNHIIYVRRNGKSYWCGNSHLGDIEQLRGVINVLSNDWELKDKFKVIIAGWDAEGDTTEYSFNNEFKFELEKRGLWTSNIIKAINSSKGNVDMLPIPNELKNKYRNKIFNESKRSIKSEESVYYQYEKILTDNHNMIKNEDYLSWLMNFERNIKYDNEGNYARRWTEKANIYAKVLDETDIVLAPLSDNKFNHLKSNLKQVECWSRKLPIVCSDIPPYNIHGKHMKNCILIPPEKNARKYWIKNLKKLILDPNLRKELGENLYNDFKDEYHLTNVTKKRADFYKRIINKNNK